MNMKKRYILGIIVLAVVIHYSYMNYSRNQVYIAKFEALEQELRFVTQYYFRHGEDDLSELKQHLYEVPIAVKPRSLSRFPGNTEKIYTRMDFVLEKMAQEFQKINQIPALFEKLKTLEDEVETLLKTGKVNHISDETYERMMALLLEIEKLN